MSQNFADPQQFSARLEEIVATGQESADLLELKDGRVFDRSSKLLTLEGEGEGRALICRPGWTPLPDRSPAIRIACSRFSGTF